MAEKKQLNIHESMLKFHAEFHGATKSGMNPHFKSKHFTLEDLIHATTPILNKLGLYIVHQVQDGMLNTSLLNAAGENITSGIPLTLSNNPQANGSLLTYYRRYNLVNLLNIAEADDDGNAAMMEADLQEQRAKKKEIKPKPKATKAQKTMLLKYVADGNLNKRQVDYIEAHIDKLSVDDADDLLKRIEGEQK